MPSITQSFDPKLLEPGLAKVTFEEIGKDKPYTKPIIKKQGPDFSPYKDRIVTKRVGGLGPMYERGEALPIDFDMPWTEPEKTTAYRSLGLGVRFSEHIWRNDLYGVMKQVASSLGKSHDLTKDLDVAQLYDNFFATTYYTGPDGLALGSTAHTSYGGGASRANIPDTSDSFDYDSLIMLRRMLREHKNSRGIPTPLGTSGLILLCPTTIFDEATKLLAPLSKYEPTTDHNAVNVLQEGTNWQIIENPYLTSTTQFFVISPDALDIHLVDSQAATPHSEVDSLTDFGYVYTIRCMYAIHCAHWEGITATGNAA